MRANHLKNMIPRNVQTQQLVDTKQYCSKEITGMIDAS